MKKILSSLLLCFLLQTLQAQSIDEKKLIEIVQYLSSDNLRGRKLGTTENALAREYIAGHFKEIGLKPAFGDEYHQHFEHPVKAKNRKKLLEKASSRETLLSGGNVVGIIEGKSSKTIALTAHIDHLGVRKGKIFNGADDNASGTAALVIIGEYFKKNPLNHTLVVAAVDAEEMGMTGSMQLVNDFPGDLKNVVLNVNMDMIAHNDNHELYACGTYHYPSLKDPLQQLNTPINLLFGHDDPKNIKQQNWTYSSDHKNFHAKKIPFVYFGVEDHKDYHKPTDTFENINQPFYISAVKLIIQAIEKLDKSL